MDDLIATADLEDLADLIAFVYLVSQFDARSRIGPRVRNPQLAALLDVARRRYWDGIEATKAQGQAEEEDPNRPAWLRKRPGPGDTEA